MLEYERYGPGRFVRFGTRSAPFFAFRIGKKENNISEERISMNIDFESRNITRRSFLKGAGVVGAAGLLSACGGSKSNNAGSTAASGVEAPNSTGATPLKEYISWESANREIESWNLLYSQTLSDANVVTNLWDGLMSFDCYGKLVPAIATSWEANEDSTVWTFHLRDDVDWVDCNGEVKEHITATDFLVGLEWALRSTTRRPRIWALPPPTCTIRICWTQAWASRLPTTTLWCSPAKIPAPTLTLWPPTPASTPPLRC